MIGRNHLRAGVLGWVALAPGLVALDVAGPAEVAAGALVAAGMSLVADVDHPASTVGRSLGPLSGAVARQVARCSGGHRGATHSLLVATATAGAMGAFALVGPLAVFVLAALCGAWTLALVGPHRLRRSRLLAAPWAILTGLAAAHFAAAGAWILAAALVGTLSHLAADSLTCGPMPLLWPLRRRYCLSLFTTDHGAEAIVGKALAVAVVLTTWLWTMPRIL